MNISMYSASVPVFVRALNNLTHVLKKGEAHAQAKNLEPDLLLQQRLIFDMLPLVKQVQIACDMAARGAARLAGVEPQSFEDNEKTFAEVYARIERASAYVLSFKPEQIDGSEARAIHLKMRNGEMDFTGIEYLQGFTLPNLYFHCTTAYAILRVAGVEIGKMDFIGQK
ncbi:MAG TPA: DUF1993 domain-containing protein [Rhodanobacteraceae bacterium]|nr:DUF1993 domain-containing protein [Rhodanobacteraceae bacterium]